MSKFTFPVAPNLGNLKFFRDRKGAKKYPLNADNSELEDFDLEKMIARRKEMESRRNMEMRTITQKNTLVLLKSKSLRKVSLQLLSRGKLAFKM